ncbi:MAG: hypothetical protein V4448_17615 [Pseudomonadota bacterium]
MKQIKISGQIKTFNKTRSAGVAGSIRISRSSFFIGSLNPETSMTKSISIVTTAHISHTLKKSINADPRTQARRPSLGASICQGFSRGECRYQGATIRRDAFF